MYREARALGLDQGDEMIRERIILKMRNLVYGNVTIRQPDPGELQAWLAAHRERYDLPRRFAFEQLMLGEDDDAMAALAAARAADAVPAPQANRLRRYGSRSRAAVATTFGASFADPLAAATPGEWSLLESDDGRHLARVTAVQEAVPATLEGHRGRIEADWQEAQAQLSVMDQLADLRARYELRRQDGVSATNTATLASRADGSG